MEEEEEEEDKKKNKVCNLPGLYNILASTYGLFWHTFFSLCVLACCRMYVGGRNFAEISMSCRQGIHKGLSLGVQTVYENTKGMMCHCVTHPIHEIV